MKERTKLQRFLFDYIYETKKRFVINELRATSLDQAIEFFDEHFLELHAEGETEISAIRLRTDQDEEIASYKLHNDVIAK